MHTWRLLSLAAIAGLTALTGIRQFGIEPLAGQTANIVWFVIQVAPLILVLPGVLLELRVGLLAAVLVACLYVLHGVLQIADPADRVAGICELGGALVLFAAATMLLRRISRQQASDS